MRNFLLKILLFSVVFFMIDKVFIVVRNRLPSLEADKRLEKLINGEINADVYVMGSSRGARNVIPLQIEEAIGKSVFNISYPGSNIDFHEFLLSEMLVANKTPEQIILVMDDYYELIEFPSLKFRYDRLLPLVKYPRIIDALSTRGEKNKTLSKFLVLHQLNRSNLNFIPKSFTKNDSIFENGAMTVSFMSPNFDKKFNDRVNPMRYKIDEESEILRNKFLSFVNICAQNNIDLVLCYSPNFKNNNIAFQNRIKELTEGKLGYMEFDRSKETFKDPENYSDSAHLQKRGAKLFTEELIHYLKSERKS